MRSRFPKSAILALLFSVFLPASSSAETFFNSVWQAKSGKLPPTSCSWRLLDSQDLYDPFFNGEALRFRTVDVLTTMGYTQSGDDISLHFPFEVEVRARYVSGYTALESRTHMAVAFEIAPYTWNALQIGPDEIFLLRERFKKGPAISLDTQDAFHTYRIRISVAGNIDVYYDDSLVLEGHTFMDDKTDGLPGIYWGDGTTSAFGISEWSFVRHNSSAVPCGLTLATRKTTWGGVKAKYDR